MKLLDRRLQIMMGKGGVGKSLVSAAFASIGVKQGKKVLLIQINTKDKISEYLGINQAQNEIREVIPGLYVVNISPVSAMKEYVLMQVKLELIYRMVFENKAVRYFLRAVPALNDLVVLGKIYYHFSETVKGSDKPLYDMIIVDAPPTGHGLFLLNLPNVMLGAVKSGPVFREATNMKNMLQNQEHTAINLVTLPEEMPVSETTEMYRNIQNELQMPLGALFVNGIYPEILGEKNRQKIQENGQSITQKALVQLLKATEILDKRHQMSLGFAEEIKSRVRIPKVEIPYIFSKKIGLKETEFIADTILRELSAC